jgi:hypothetical protein
MWTGFSTLAQPSPHQLPALNNLIGAYIITEKRHAPLFPIITS